MTLHFRDHLVVSHHFRDTRAGHVRTDAYTRWFVNIQDCHGGLSITTTSECETWTKSPHERDPPLITASSSMRTLSRFFHLVANSSVESVTRKGFSMPEWGVYKTRIEERSDRQTNQKLNLIFLNWYYAAYVDRLNRFYFRRNWVKTLENDFTLRRSCCDVDWWNQHQASWTLKLMLCRATYWASPQMSWGQTCFLLKMTKSVRSHHLQHLYQK